MRKFVMPAMVTVGILLLTPMLFYQPTTAATKINVHELLTKAPGLNPDALHMGIKSLHYAEQEHKVKNHDLLTVIDFTKPSSVKRLWVFDLKHATVLMNTYTTQGKNSGLVYATDFSNRNNSLKTSLGAYVTLGTYHGHHGLSMRLQGIEKGINDNALRRAIIVHPAWYATPEYVSAHHRAGRSWACFALNPALSKQFIQLTRGGSVIFAYADSEKNDPYLV